MIVKKELCEQGVNDKSLKLPFFIYFFQQMTEKNRKIPLKSLKTVLKMLITDCIW